MIHFSLSVQVEFPTEENRDEEKKEKKRVVEECNTLVKNGNYYWQSNGYDVDIDKDSMMLIGSRSAFVAYLEQQLNAATFLSSLFFYAELVQWNESPHYYRWRKQQPLEKKTMRTRNRMQRRFPL